MRPSASLRLRFIQPAEILEHQAPLLGGETGELVPRRVADFRPGAGRPRLECARDMHAVAQGRAAGALLLFVGLIAGEGAARVEELAIESQAPRRGPHPLR